MIEVGVVDAIASLYVDAQLLLNIFPVQEALGIWLGGLNSHSLRNVVRAPSRELLDRSVHHGPTPVKGRRTGIFAPWRRFPRSADPNHLRYLDTPLRAQGSQGSLCGIRGVNLKGVGVVYGERGEIFSLKKEHNTIQDPQVRNVDGAGIGMMALGSGGT